MLVSGVGGFIAAAACGRLLARSAPSDPRVAALERLIREGMEKRDVPGVSIALIRDGRLFWTGGFGVRDRSSGAPVDADTVFSAQSMSKPVFAYRVMKLAELGVLDLDAPLTRYAAEPFVPDDPRLAQITARRVLSHTSGLPNWRSPDKPLRIAFEPGSQWSYSGEGYHYLQTVVTRLAGHADPDPAHCGTYEMGYRVCATDFGAYMEANVLRPFGMRHSGYVWTPALMRRVARRHDASGAPMPVASSTAIDVARYGSAGSLMTTAPDFARFLIEVMDPRPADRWRLRASSLRQMLEPVIAIPAPIKASWALGWQVWHLEKGDIVVHGGDDTGWHSQSGFSPQRRTGFVVLTNGENGLDLIGQDLLVPLVDWL